MSTRIHASRPLVSFCVRIHNQRAFVQEVLAGAFAQTYRPLEIVVFDDGSTDGSRESIQDAVARQAPSDVALIVHHGTRSLGNLGSWEACCQLAHGTLFVTADGDDISWPNRTERIVSAWLQDGCRASVILHGARRVDGRGRPLGNLATPHAEAPVGAVMAYIRETLTAFGPIQNPRIVHDEVWSRRALMLGPQLRLDEPLMDYRVGTGISSFERWDRMKLAACWRGIPDSFEQVRRDLEHLRARLGEDAAADWNRRLDEEESRSRAYVTLLTSPHWSERLAAFRSVRPPSILSPAYWWRAAFLLPRIPGDLLLGLYYRIKAFVQASRP